MSLTGALYYVFYKDKNGIEHYATYFARNAYAAEQRYQSEQRPGERFIMVMKARR